MLFSESRAREAGWQVGGEVSAKLKTGDIGSPAGVVTIS
jgi:hypothetical protein